MRVRIKTRKQLEKVYGEYWEQSIPSGWNMSMDNLLGEIIEVDMGDGVYPGIYKEGNLWWNIDKEMIAEFLDESKKERTFTLIQTKELMRKAYEAGHQHASGDECGGEPYYDEEWVNNFFTQETVIV